MTSFTDLVGCEHPIQLAPIGAPGANLDLPTAVAEAGGHPVYPAVFIPADQLAERLDALSEKVTSFGVNFIAPLLEPEALEVAAEKAAMVDFFYGAPDPALVATVHAGGALASWQVGSREEAVAAVEAGCELVVAQGVEAGGRVRGTLELLPLLDQVVAAVEVPVLAAGGIASAAGVEAALDAGAAGVRVGTRFVASEEADAHPLWKQAILKASGDDAVITKSFAVGVPDFPHRVLRQSLDAAEARGPGPVGEIDLKGKRTRVSQFESHPPTATAEGAIEAMPFYAGTSSGEIGEIKPAREIVAELAGVREIAR